MKILLECKKPNSLPSHPNLMHERFITTDTEFCLSAVFALIWQPLFFCPLAKSVSSNGSLPRMS